MATITNLFLDDYRQPTQAFSYTKDSDYLKKPWDVVINYNQFVSYLQKKVLTKQVAIDTVSFDHDLAPEHYAPETRWGDYNEWAVGQEFQEKTGYDCAKYLIEFCKQYDIKLPKVKIHSMNPVGRNNIKALFDEAGR